MADHRIRQRLALIRHLYLRASDQAEEPEPLCALAVLSLHDCAEMLIRLICEEKDIMITTSPGFMDYWKLCAPKVELPHKARMDHLNTVRNSLKHKGALPSRTEVLELRDATGAFLEDCASQTLGTPLRAALLTELVRYKQCRLDLEKAARAAADGRLDEAMDRVAMAFVYLIDEYQASSEQRYGRSAFSVGED